MQPVALAHPLLFVCPVWHGWGPPPLVPRAVHEQVDDRTFDPPQPRRRRNRPSQAARRARREERALLTQASRPSEPLETPTRPSSTRDVVVMALESAEAASYDAEAAAAVGRAEELVRTLRVPITRSRGAAVFSRISRLEASATRLDWPETADALSYFVQAFGQALDRRR